MPKYTAVLTVESDLATHLIATLVRYLVKAKVRVVGPVTVFTPSTIAEGDYPTAHCPQCGAALPEKLLYSTIGKLRAWANLNPGRKAVPRECPACLVSQPSTTEFKAHWGKCPARTDRRKKRVKREAGNV